MVPTCQSKHENLLQVSCVLRTELACGNKMRVETDTVSAPGEFVIGWSAEMMGKYSELDGIP